MKINLTEYEKEDLIDVHRNNINRKICDRIKSVLLLNEGYTIKEISKILLVDEDTIGNWKLNNHLLEVGGLFFRLKVDTFG